MSYYKCKDCGHVGYGNYCDNCRSSNIVPTKDEHINTKPKNDNIFITKGMSVKQYQEIKKIESQWKP